jgi:hypothetical protein
MKLAGLRTGSQDEDDGQNSEGGARHVDEYDIRSDAALYSFGQQPPSFDFFSPVQLLAAPARFSRESSSQLHTT